MSATSHGQRQPVLELPGAQFQLLAAVLLRLLGTLLRQRFGFGQAWRWPKEGAGMDAHQVRMRKNVQLKKDVHKITGHLSWSYVLVK